MTILIIIALLLLWATPSGAVDRWVNINGGDNGNSCAAMTNETTPKQSIQAGIGCLQSGDRLLIKPGVYTESINASAIPSNTTLLSTTKGGAILRPNSLPMFEFPGPQSNIVVDGFDMDAQSNLGGYIVQFRTNGGTNNGVTIQNSEIHHVRGARSCSNSGGIGYADGPLGVIIRNNYVHDIGIGDAADGSALGPGDGSVCSCCYSYGMYTGSSGTTIEGNEFARISGYAIHGYNDGANGFHTSDHTIRNNYFHDIGGPALLVGCGGHNNQVYNNIMARAGQGPNGDRGGILVGGFCSGNDSGDNYVYNNTVWNNNGDCIRLGASGSGSSSNNVVRNNICWQNGSSGVNNENGSNTIDTNLEGTNPQFAVASPTDRDGFKLASTSSPAYNTGVSTASGQPVTFTSDIGGNARIQGGAQDRGAWEFGSGVSCPALCCPGSCAAGCPINCPSSAEPIGWWKMEEGAGTTVADSSGNGHTLTLSVAPGPTFQPGLIGSASLGCNADAGLAQSTGAFPNPNYTWMFWVKMPVAPETTNNSQPIRNGNGPDTWSFAWSHTEAALRQAASHQLSTGSWVSAQIPGTLEANRAYHIAGTYDGSNLKVYLNGVLQATQLVGSIGTPANNFYVCGRPGYSEFSGLVDEVKVWNRPLTAAEIAAEYQPAARRRRHTPLSMR
jgi:hypothetical protein